MRDILTLLITKHKASKCQEENATGITCEETELVQALKEIIDRRSWPTKKAPIEVKKEEKEEGSAREEHGQSAMERLGQTVKRHFEHFDPSHFLCFLENRRPQQASA